MEEYWFIQTLPLHAQYEIQKLLKYSQTIEELLANQINGIDKKSKENAENFIRDKNENFDTKLFDVGSWNYLDFQEFKQILRASLFTTSFSFLEIQLINTCNAFQEAKQIPISVSNLKGDLLERFKVYQKKLAKLPYSR